VHNVLAIYANENGQGMAFEVNDRGRSHAGRRTPDAPPASLPALSAVPSAVPEAWPQRCRISPTTTTSRPKKAAARR
jgi:stringent starvation protein B